MAEPKRGGPRRAASWGQPLWLTACVVIPLGLMLGCAGRHSPPSPAPPPDPAAAFTAVREREERIVSLRARFSAETRSGGNRRVADGVLLVRKPDSFRLRLMLPFGLTVLDYLSIGERTSITVPLEGDTALSRRPDDLAPFSRDDLGAAFLRGGSAFPGDCAPVAAPGSEVVVECAAGARVTRKIHIEPRSGTITAETSYDAGGPRLVIRYDDYRSVAGVPLPFRIALVYPGKGVAVDIAVQGYEMNPDLGDDLFQPPGR